MCVDETSRRWQAWISTPKDGPCHEYRESGVRIALDSAPSNEKKQRFVTEQRGGVFHMFCPLPVQLER